MRELATIVIRLDRLQEIEAFLDALEEWGVTDPDLRQTEIIRHLQSPTGLTQYIDRETEEVFGNA